MPVESISRHRYQWGFCTYWVRVWRQEPKLAVEANHLDVALLVTKEAKAIGSEQTVGVPAPIAELASRILELPNICKVEVLDENGIGFALTAS